MELHDSVRYQEAVNRLKRLLREDPMHPSTSYTSLHLMDQQDSPYTSMKRISQSYSSEYLREWTDEGGGRGGGEPGAGAIQVGDDMNVPGGPIRSRKRKATPEGASGWLLELLGHQEDLIAQLEKENEFLKREILSVSDGAKKMAQENQDLSRKLAKALAEALAQDETSQSISSNHDENSQDDQTADAATKFQKDKAALEAEIDRLQSTLEATSEREQQALDKLRKALSIAEDTQAITAQVRASSESAIEELSGLLTATKEEGKELQRLLDEAERKFQNEADNQDQWKSQQQQRIKLLEDEVSDQSTTITQLESEIREKGRKITALKDDLQAAQASKARMETQLEEQRRHSKDAHARLDHIIMTRSAEAAASTTRANELEDRLTSARQDISRLLTTISSMAQGTGRIRELESTDDVKSEKLAAEQQVSSILSMLEKRQEEEVQSLQNATKQHQEAMEALKQEIASMRQQMAEDNEKQRKCLQEMSKGLSALNSTEVGDQEEEGHLNRGISSTAVSGDDSGLPSATSAVEEGSEAKVLAVNQDDGKRSEDIPPEPKELTFNRDLVVEEAKNFSKDEEIRASNGDVSIPEEESTENETENISESLSIINSDEELITEKDASGNDIESDEDKTDPQNKEFDDGNEISKLNHENQCQKCEGLSLIVNVIGEALEDVQVDVEKQGVRLNRMKSTYSTQCDNCLKYQLFLGVTSHRLDMLHVYSDSLSQRIENLTRRIRTW